MDYSSKGILIMLQDLQRIHFGMLTMYVDVILSDGNEPMVSCCVFDRDGEPHTMNFYGYETKDKHKAEYSKILELIKTIIDG